MELIRSNFFRSLPAGNDHTLASLSSIDQETKYESSGLTRIPVTPCEWPAKFAISRASFGFGASAPGGSGASKGFDVSGGGASKGFFFGCSFSLGGGSKSDFEGGGDSPDFPSGIFGAGFRRPSRR